MDSSFFQVPLGRRRRINLDGSIRVACRVCGRIIEGSSTTKITTVTCHNCTTGEPQPRQIPIIGGVARPDLMVETQEELLDAIFNMEREPTPGTVEHLAMRKRSRWSPLDLVVGAFKAIGFSQRKKTEINREEVKYDTLVEETSTQIAKRKKRESIFGGKEK